MLRPNFAQTLRKFPHRCTKNLTQLSFYKDRICAT